LKASNVLPFTRKEQIISRCAAITNRVVVCKGEFIPSDSRPHRPALDHKRAEAERMVKMSKSQIKSLTIDEQAKFLAYFHRQDKPRFLNELRACDHLIVLLMLDAGLRVGEVIQLTVGDLHVLGSPVGMIHLRPETTKTKTERSIPVTVRLHDSIQEMFLNIWQPFGYKPWYRAFANADNDWCLSSRRIQQMTKTAGIITISRPVHPHMLRHTFATRLMSKCSIRVVQQLLGHASLSSTQVYTHPNTQDLQMAIDSLNT